jgi:raffinose/stachyose/melibiose transport system substrate-binding protein
MKRIHSKMMGAVVFALSCAMLFVFMACSQPATNTPVAKSGNCVLSSLTVSAGTLTPKFAAETLNYSVSVDNAVSAITVSGTPADPKASVSGNSGKELALSVGDTAVSIVVTAEDSTTKKYTVVITRAAASTAPTTPTKTVLTILDYANTTNTLEKEIFDAFVAANPDIELNIEYQYDEAYHTRLSSLDSAGTLPDVMYLWVSRSGYLLQNHKTKDLSALLPADLLSNFPSNVKNPSIMPGGYLGMLPRGITYTGIMYVNKKLLSDNGLVPATTYTQMKAQVATLQAKGIATLGIPGFDSWTLQSCLLSTMVGRLLGNDFLPAAKSGSKSLNGSEFVGVLSAYKTLVEDGVLSSAMANLNYGDAPAMFAQGKIAYYIDGDWRIGTFNDSSAAGYLTAARQSGEIELMPIPSFTGETNAGCASTVPGTGWGLNASIASGSDKEKAAVRLLSYLYSKEVLTKYLEAGSFVPNRSDVTSTTVSPLIAKQLAFYKANLKSCYVIDTVLPSDVYNPLDTGLQDILKGTKTPQQVGDSIETSMAAWRAK